DAVTSVPRESGVDPPWFELERWFEGRLGTHWSETDFTTPVPGPYLYSVELSLSDGQRVGKKEVEIESVADRPEVEIDTSDIPRRVVLDREALDRWKRSDEAEWASSYAM